ncbi:WD40 domain-containing protein [Acaryochloris marina]|uniref:WD-repeat protein n=1 Tax=Acaryochloris marina (strain MBIC 11017) TaxID=329726 RepID=A8ZL84_ACAM1|nr:WD repeat-containing protein [Acaryochloris marina]ABW31911.1 WD-repeat protein [Acaryochloris marina MBIC11017]
MTETSFTVGTEHLAQLEELAWTIEMSEGQFTLILANCNYAQLRTALIQRLAELCSVAIKPVHLNPDAVTLYSAIQQQLGQQVPPALMVTGLESLEALEQVLTSANQAREEFRKRLPVPMVLWLDDDLLKQMVRLVPDLKSWGTSFRFQAEPVELVQFLQDCSQRLFTKILDVGQFVPNSEVLGKRNRQEISYAIQALETPGTTLNPKLQATVIFAQGRNAYAKGDLKKALDFYQHSLQEWPDSEQPSGGMPARTNDESGSTSEIENSRHKGIVLIHQGWCYQAMAQQDSSQTAAFLEQAKQSFEQGLDCLGASSELGILYLGQLGEVLHQLENWDALDQLALNLYQNTTPEKHPLQYMEALVLRAQVCNHRQTWEPALDLTEEALQIWEVGSTEIQVLAQQQILRMRMGLLSAQAQQALGKSQAAIDDLEQTIAATDASADPHLFVEILEQLRQLYFDQKDYQKAFETKQLKTTVKLKFRLQAFIGAGQLQPQLGDEEGIDESLVLSGRQQDIEVIVNERLSQDQYKLVILYGPSGVGKSSLVKAGLVPVLQQRVIRDRKTLPVVVNVYSNWVAELQAKLEQAASVPHTMKTEISGVETSEDVSQASDVVKGETGTSDSLEQIKQQLKHNVEAQRLTVLVFDQFEEFFFNCQEPGLRRRFYEFLQACLDGRAIPFVKVVLSLREDYFHYLLEFGRFTTRHGLEQDVLRQDNRYYLGNFDLDSARLVTERLAKRAQFHVQSQVIERLIGDLATELDQVRPIELQVSGAQLQTENITTLQQYEHLGEQPKKVLASRWLEQVVEDCGPENNETAWKMLVSLTDSKGTRPLRTEQELWNAVSTFALLDTEDSNLQDLPQSNPEDLTHFSLILRILQGSGLIVHWPQEQDDRFQLVHDYLVEPIRQHFDTDLEQKLRSERQARQKAEAGRAKLLKISLGGAFIAIAGLIGLLWRAENLRYRAERREANAEVLALSLSSKNLFDSNYQLKSLTKALMAGQNLRDYEEKQENRLENHMYGVATLRDSVYNIRQQNNLEGHTDAVLALAYSPDGSTLATASSDKTVKLWSKEGSLITTLEGHTDLVLALAYSPDGSTLATASYDKTVKLWSKEGSLITTLEGHTDAVLALAYSPDGSTLATASSDNTVKLWSKEGSLITTLEGHTDAVLALAYSPDGSTLATASSDNTVKLWSKEGSLITTLEGHTDLVLALAYSPDGSTLATASSDNTVKLWSKEGSLITTLEGHTAAVGDLAYSPDGSTLATASDDKTVKLWSKEGSLITTLEGHTAAVGDLAYSPDGSTLATASRDNTVKLWSKEGSLITTLEGHTDLVLALAYSPDGSTLATASYDKTVKLRSKEGSLITTLEGHTAAVLALAYSPDGSTLATASSDNTVKLWSKEGSLITTLEGHTDLVNTLAYSPDGSTLATASRDNTVKLWSKEGSLITTLEGHTDAIWALAYSPDGSTLATASDDNTVKLWSKEGSLITTLEGHTDAVGDLAYSPDGSTLATASSDNTVKLWSKEGSLITTLEGHTYAIWDLAYSPDGSTLATASRDNTVKLWSKEGSLITTLEGHTDVIWALAYSLDGSTLATASRDKTVKLWNFELEDLLKRGCQWLSGYFIRHPQELELLTVCHSPAILSLAALGLVRQGQVLAEAGNMEKARQKLQTALKWSPKLDLDPETEMKDRDAKKLVIKWAAPAKAEKAKQLARQGKVSDSILIFRELQSWQDTDKAVEISASSWNSLCWFGSLHRKAKSVMFACEKAVAFDPSHGGRRDSRGLARALTNNPKGAIEDFEAYIKLSNRASDRKKQRQSWIDALKAGKDPFTDEVLDSLFDE